MAELWLAGVIVFGGLSAFLIVLLVAQAIDRGYEPSILVEFGIAGVLGDVMYAALHLRGFQWISVLAALLAVALTIWCYIGWKHEGARAREPHNGSAALHMASNNPINESDLSRLSI